MSLISLVQVPMAPALSKLQKIEDISIKSLIGVRFNVHPESTSKSLICTSGMPGSVVNFDVKLLKDLFP